MNKIILFLLVLTNVNCFAVDEAVWEFWWWKDWYRFFIIAEQIEETKNPLQKEILKLNLSTEAKYLEKLIMKEINRRIDTNTESPILYEMLQQIDEELTKAVK